MNFTERHFSVPDLALIFSLSQCKIRDLFREEEHVLRISHPKPNKREHVKLIIPESVAHRVLGRFEVPPLPDRLRLSHEQLKEKILRERRRKRLERKRKREGL